MGIFLWTVFWIGVYILTLALNYVISLKIMSYSDYSDYKGSILKVIHSNEKVEAPASIFMFLSVIGTIVLLIVGFIFYCETPLMEERMTNTRNPLRDYLKKRTEKAYLRERTMEEV